MKGKRSHGVTIEEINLLLATVGLAVALDLKAVLIAAAVGFVAGLLARAR